MTKEQNPSQLKTVKNDCPKVLILATNSKKEFLRKAWIELAKEDVPIEVFSSDFDEVIQDEHEIFIDKISADVSYQVSIGYDREEPYIDYETYYEDEPYITTESYYDRDTKSTKTRQVTEYKKVRKERQVTRYKTVTDWSALNGTHHAKSTVIVENIAGKYLDRNLFLDSFNHLKADESVLIVGDDANKLHVVEPTRMIADAEHDENIEGSVIYSLPGDHFRDLDYTVKNVSNISSTLYKVPEYKASLFYNGNTYIKYAFPFGAMSISGDKIENKISLDNVIRQMKDESQSTIRKRNEDIDKNIRKKTNVFSFVTIGLLLLSIIISCFIHITTLVVVAFVLAVTAFVANTIYVKKKSYSERQNANDDIEKETQRVNNEILNYEKNYKTKQREALNNKLTSLGLEPVSASEIGG